MKVGPNSHVTTKSRKYKFIENDRSEINDCKIAFVVEVYSYLFLIKISMNEIYFGNWE